MPHDYDPDALFEAERDIHSRLAGQPVDLEVQHAISNLYRAATVVSRTAEREVLADAHISWSGFTVLWVLWVWGEMASSRLAAELGLTLGTLTGVRRSLEQDGLVATTLDPADARRRLIALTDEGDALIREIYPAFNGWATTMLDGLAPDQVSTLAALLQSIIVRPTIETADGDD